MGVSLSPSTEMRVALSGHVCEVIHAGNVGISFHPYMEMRVVLRRYILDNTWECGCVILSVYRYMSMA